MSSLSHNPERKQARSEGNGVPQWLVDLGIGPGGFYFETRARMEALMRDSAWTDKARVFACLSLHTMAFQCEEATKLNRGKRIPLTRGDIADDTGLDVSRVRKALVSLEHEGYLERRAPNGLVRGEITIHCWAVPRLNGVQAAEPKTQTRFDLPADLPPYLTRWMRRFKVAAVTPLMLEKALPICENLDRWEGELRGILKPETQTENGVARRLTKKQGTGLRASTSGGSAPPIAYNKERARIERKGKKEEIICPSAAAAPVLPREQQQPTVVQYPKTDIEIKAHDKGVSADFAALLVARSLEYTAAAGIDAALVNDETISQAVAESYRTYRGKGGHGSGLLLMRVPEILCAWDKED